MVLSLSTNVASAADDSCQDAYFLSLRGSGQTSSGVNDQNASPETKKVFDSLNLDLQSHNRPLSIGFRQVDYLAPSVDVLFRGIFTNPSRLLAKENLGEYLRGENGGESALFNALGDIRRTCNSHGKEPVFVLAGYSQGALVIHNVLNRLQDHSSPFSKLVQGVALIGDPGRMPSTAIPNFGTAPRASYSYGVCRILDNAPGNDTCRLSSGGPMVEVPTAFRDRTFQTCMSGDIICDTGEILRLRDIFGAIQYGRSIHGQYPASDSTAHLGRAISQRLQSLSGIGANPIAPQANAPILTPAASVAGYRVAVQAQSCPDIPQPQSFRMSLRGRNGASFGEGVSGVAPDGQIRGAYFNTNTRQVPGSTPVLPEPPTGVYELQSGCFIVGTNTSTKSYAPARYTVTGPSPMIRASVTKAARNSSVTFSGQGCRGGTQAFADLVPFSETNVSIGTDHTPVKSDGTWSVRYVIPANLDPGRYGITGLCLVGSGFTPISYGYSGSLDIS